MPLAVSQKLGEIGLHLNAFVVECVRPKAVAEVGRAEGARRHRRVVQEVVVVHHHELEVATVLEVWRSNPCTRNPGLQKLHQSILRLLQ